uniref:Uncharacterized protein n=1 Tax=Anopheles dirus TaxID=7168 RepID=A0A182NXU2_9DIPT
SWQPVARYVLPDPTRIGPDGPSNRQIVPSVCGGAYRFSGCSPLSRVCVHGCVLLGGRGFRIQTRNQHSEL